LIVPHHDGSLLAVVLVEGEQVGQRVLAGDVAVEDEEGLTVFLQNLAGQSQRTSWRERERRHDAPHAHA